jgi:hypothetical protein
MKAKLLLTHAAKIRHSVTFDVYSLFCFVKQEMILRKSKYCVNVLFDLAV